MPLPFPPFRDDTSTYSWLHGWFYENVVAPAVLHTRYVIDEHFLKALPSGAHVLDVGSGGAQFTQYLADRRPDINIIGIDLSIPQIQRANKRMRGYGERVQFQRGDATRLQFGDCRFDGVISYGSIKHWTSREAGLAECLRVLKPEGPLLIVEVDRSMTFDTAYTFVSQYRAPRLLHGPILAMFRTWVAGRSIDLDDARTIADGLDLINKDARRIPDSPLLLISGRRTPAQVGGSPVHAPA
ncbi:Demethylrebeccamycin-D-glucose O-methyltransferase [Mycobacterium basiliense]|uniref:Demethylrebeccamycin-D-glucose O-methyltransferase n=1 Tax=Mycobacterium basiliense TaxID=2094119 RepID=A0A3S4BGK0_9MYCO|nr:class I SAM-dependent methyltransferase [Mycobacterium basiliense]VDM87742.1 Demethylrebeccamycin-D-glucose O-methyltransferase [Mycobacterium basiliense]